MDDLIKKRKKLNKIVIEDIEDYYDTFKCAVKMSALSRRPSRILRDLDITITEVVRMLHRQEAIYLFMTDNLTRFVMPIAPWIAMTETEQIAYRKKISNDNKPKSEREAIEAVPSLPVSTFFTKKEKNHDF